MPSKNINLHNSLSSDEESLIPAIEPSRVTVDDSAPAGEFKKSQIYLCVSILFSLLVIGSFVKEYVQLQPSYFSNKYNPLNQYFAKYSWGWTTTPLTLYFLVLIASNYSEGYIGMRSVVYGTIYWIFATRTFNAVYVSFGACQKKENLNYESCKSDWMGPDISGHSFLLIHSICWILTNYSLIRRFELFSKLLRIYYLLLIIFWMLMLAVTSLYFHTITEKVYGALAAVLFWIV
jgi:hypothetical protein